MPSAKSGMAGPWPYVTPGFVRSLRGEKDAMLELARMDESLRRMIEGMGRLESETQDPVLRQYYVRARTSLEEALHAVADAGQQLRLRRR